MIVKNLSSADVCHALHDRLEKGFDFLRNTDLTKLPDGRVDIEGDDVFAVVQTYETKPPEAYKIELHRKYLDIQYVFEGKEQVLISRDKELRTAIPYDDDNDIEFFEDPEECSAIFLSAGDFALFDLNDYHKPRCNPPDGTSQKVRKVVVKIRV